MTISRNGALPLGLAAAVIVAALVAGTIMPGRAAAQATFTATLSGDAEVPAVITDATGSFTATIRDGALDYTLTSDATGITAAHIHIATPFENGPFVAFLFGPEDPGVDGVDTSGTITVDDLLDVVAGDWGGFVAAFHDGTAYVNVHTEANAGGEVRGQIVNAAAQADPAALVEQYLAAISAGDVDAAVALFTDDVVLEGDVCNLDACVGIDAARASTEQDVEDQINLTLASAEVIDGTVTGTVELRSPELTQFGIERLVFALTAEVRDGKIARINAELDLTDSETAEVAALFERFEEEGAGAQPASAVELLGLLSAAGFDPALQEIATTRPWIPVSAAGVLVVAGGRAEVYELDSPQAVGAALDQFPGLTANVTIWGSGSLIVILLDAPDSPAAEEALFSVLGGPAIATIAGLIPPPEVPAEAPDALPDTGSGGLAADGGGSSGWIWALLAAGLTLGAGLAVRRTLPRRS